MKLYKLSFEDQNTFNTFKSEHLTTEEGNFKKGISVIQIGNVVSPATYDEDGEELTPEYIHQDWAVDIVSDFELPEVEPYLIEAKTHYVHMVAGVDNKTAITK